MNDLERAGDVPLREPVVRGLVSGLARSNVVVALLHDVSPGHDRQHPLHNLGVGGLQKLSTRRHSKRAGAHGLLDELGKEVGDCFPEGSIASRRLLLRWRGGRRRLRVCHANRTETDDAGNEPGSFGVAEVSLETSPSADSLLQQLEKRRPHRGVGLHLPNDGVYPRLPRGDFVPVRLHLDGAEADEVRQAQAGGLIRRCRGRHGLGRWR